MNKYTEKAKCLDFTQDTRR